MADQTKQLSDRERRFVDEYLSDLNCSRVAREIGITPQAAQQIRRRPHVRAEIEKAIKERRQENKPLIRRTIEELTRLAFSDIRKVFSQGPEGELLLRPLEEMDDETAASIASISQREFAGGDGETAQKAVSLTLKFYNKNTALAQLTKLLGLDKLPEGATELAEELARAGEQVARRLAQLRSSRAGGVSPGDDPGGEALA